MLKVVSKLKKKPSNIFLYHFSEISAHMVQGIMTH
jgi:hypothetical protein